MGEVRFDEIRVGARTLRLGADLVLPLRPEPRTGGARVAFSGRLWHLRAWTWAERRRVLDRCALDADALDLDLCVDLAAELLVTPAPPPELAEVLGLCALAWSAGAGAAQPAPVPARRAAEVVLALGRATGWDPGELADLPAAEVDQLYAALAGEGAPAPPPRSDDGFTTYLLAEG